MISNVFALILYFSPRPNRPRDDDRPRNIIIERLEFEKSQIEAYDRMIQKHRQQIHRLDDEIREAKTRLYGSLGTGYSAKEKDSLVQRLNDLQREIEYVHVNHFLDIKNLCYEQQLGDFDALTKDMAHIFRPKPMR